MSLAAWRLLPQFSLSKAETVAVLNIYRIVTALMTLKKLENLKIILSKCYICKTPFGLSVLFDSLVLMV